jgi:hypothetical protein
MEQYNKIINTIKSVDLYRLTIVISTHYSAITELWGEIRLDIDYNMLYSITIYN